MLGYQELVDDPQIVHNGTFVEYDHPTEGHVKTPGFPYRFSQDAAPLDRGAPLVGEHTREVLAEAGFSGESIEALLGAGLLLRRRRGDGCRSRRGRPSTAPRCGAEPASVVPA